MEIVRTSPNGTQQIASDPLHFARSYQLEALEKAIRQNTIVYLETGSGKTLIAIMLLRSYAYLLRKPSRFIAVLLVPKVVLVTQQANAVKMHTDLKVGEYWGEMGVDFWDAAMWKQEVDKYEVLVMTPVILLDALRHCYLKLDLIKVLLFDECHNARGNHPYVCIMKEFYHRQLLSDKSQHLPRVFGMTASPVKAKGSSSASTYWKDIRDLENLMNSKVYTCASESVLAEYIPISTPKLRFYKHVDIPNTLFEGLANELKNLMTKHECSLKSSKISESTAESVRKRLSKLHSTFLFCLSELGVWLAFKAAESLSCEKTDISPWGKLDVFGERFVRNFILDVLKIFSTHIPSGPGWSISHDVKADMDAGYLTSKVICLTECLLEYRNLKDLRCIIFVERVITAIVLRTLLRELLPKLTGWKTDYTAGNHSGLRSQSRKEQNNIVDEFRKGMVNIIVASSILEEGLDVQSCNLVIRFDPSASVCSFIQSRGRARMHNSDFVLMVESEDSSMLSCVMNYLSTGDKMREESLRHASVPCAPLDNELYNEVFYQVETTGAIVTLNSSVALVYHYCSRLPSDRYFKPSLRCVIDESGVCTLYFPNSCPFQTVQVEGNSKTLKQLACLEACKKLHQMGALTDNLVPDIVVEEAIAQEPGCGLYVDEQVKFVPPELVHQCASDSSQLYHCYLIKPHRDFQYDIPLHDIVLATKAKLEFGNEDLSFDLEVDNGHLIVHMKYVEVLSLTPEQVCLCQRFQLTLFRVLLDHKFDKVKEILDAFQLRNDLTVLDYLLLPSSNSSQRALVDWTCVGSVLFPYENSHDNHVNGSNVKCNGHPVLVKNGWVCSCMLENSLVCTPHNQNMYCINGTVKNLDGHSLLQLKDGVPITYKKYYENRHGINLHFEREPLLNARHMFSVQNYLLRCKQQHKEKETTNTSVELPPEVCSIMMSPISVSTFYSFSFIPSIMHRIESLLIAVNLKKMHVDHCIQNDFISIGKVLEAITTKKCQERFHLESLETLGDSFLKYAVCQQLFKTFQNHHQGLLSAKKDNKISNAMLCKLGCDRKLQGFIRNEPFDPKKWIIPGYHSTNLTLNEELLSTTRKMYSMETRKIKSKTVADVVEALIGAFLSTGGEIAALSFVNWLGITTDLSNIPYGRHFPVQPEMLVNIKYFKSLLNYSFRDTSLLVEALTHGSYMLPEIPRSYQRLEFLGDSVLDYLITVHLYNKYPGLSPGLLTDLRSASVNNDCYAQAAVKAGLYKHILHVSNELQRDINTAVENFKQFALESTFGWESETKFSKVLADVIESLAGAIFVDCGYNKETVFRSIRPLLEPMITPDTVRLHPGRELNDLCQKQHYNMKMETISSDGWTKSIRIEADGVIYQESCSASNKKTAKRLACKAILKSLKESISNKN